MFTVSTPMQTIEFTFDPTKFDQQERYRLKKLQWLPPLAEEVKLQRLPAINRVSYKSNSASTENQKSSRINRFPIISIKDSNKMKQTMKMNPNARYLMSLHQESIKDAERKGLDQQRRELFSIQTYDWNLVKKVSQEHQFRHYIEALRKNGAQLQLEDKKEYDCAKKFDKVESGILGSQNSDEIDNNSTQESFLVSEEVQDYLKHLESQLSKSPFQTRRKLEPLPIQSNQNEVHLFGKPTQLKEENDFQRLFSELDTLGSTIAHRAKILVAETEKHTIPLTIVFFNNAASCNRCAELGIKGFN
jgi:hypothetical protein